MENRRVTRTIEFICIPFSSENECKQNKRRIKKEYKSPFYKFDSKVKHYQFKNIHLVVRIKGATARDLSNIDLPIIKFV